MPLSTSSVNKLSIRYTLGMFILEKFLRKRFKFRIHHTFFPTLLNKRHQKYGLQFLCLSTNGGIKMNRAINIPNLIREDFKYPERRKKIKKIRETLIKLLLSYLIDLTAYIRLVFLPLTERFNFVNKEIVKGKHNPRVLCYTLKSSNLDRDNSSR